MRSERLIRAIALVCAAANFAPAHDLITTKITWAREISRLVNSRCVACHGEKSPVPLATYSSARPWAKSIRDEVLSRRMPPWGAVKGYGDLREDPSLSQEQINQIAEWVEGGAPEGDVRYLETSTPSSWKPAVNRSKLKRYSHIDQPVKLYGVRPLRAVEDGKLHAKLPDGRLIPVIWLRGYKDEWHRTFYLREPLRLPAGSKLIPEPPFPFAVSLFPTP